MEKMIIIAALSKNSFYQEFKWAVCNAQHKIFTIIVDDFTDSLTMSLMQKLAPSGYDLLPFTNWSEFWEDFISWNETVDNRLE